MIFFLVLQVICAVDFAKPHNESILGRVHLVYVLDNMIALAWHMLMGKNNTVRVCSYYIHWLIN